MHEVIAQHMIAQVSYFTMLTRLLDMTHLFQFSRLFHTQWRTNPAVAITSLIIYVYKHRSVLTAQHADVAPTTVGDAYLRFMQKVNTDTCALYADHRHICAWPKHHNSHKSLFCRSQTLNFVECDPGPHKTTKYIIWVLLVVRKCASGHCINDFSDIMKTHFSHIAL